MFCRILIQIVLDGLLLNGNVWLIIYPLLACDFGVRGWF